MFDAKPSFANSLVEEIIGSKHMGVVIILGTSANNDSKSPEDRFEMQSFSPRKNMNDTCINTNLLRYKEIMKISS